MTLPPPPWAPVLRRLCAIQGPSFGVALRGRLRSAKPDHRSEADSIAQAPGRRSEAGLGSAHSAAHIMDPQRLQHTQLCFSWALTNQPSYLRLPRPGIEPRPLV